MTRPAPSNAAPSAKQLVFLFMAATVVAVVVFLCGVLVGRGVPLGQSVDEAAAGATPDLGEPVESFGTPAVSDAAGRIEDLSYFERLEAREPVPEQIVPVPPPVPDIPVADTPAPAPARASAAVAEATRPDEGFTVQVAALRGRPEADQIVQRLIDKGYDAYVVDPVPGAPAAVYRVRVGRSLARQDAEELLRRLETQEQFKPWITR